VSLLLFLRGFLEADRDPSCTSFSFFSFLFSARLLS
jgi:hypothetical protein